LAKTVVSATAVERVNYNLSALILVLPCPNEVSEDRMAFVSVANEQNTVEATVAGPDAMLMMLAEGVHGTSGDPIPEDTPVNASSSMPADRQPARTFRDLAVWRAKHTSLCSLCTRSPPVLPGTASDSCLLYPEAISRAELLSSLDHDLNAYFDGNGQWCALARPVK
jgi:hypothetical protein